MRFARGDARGPHRFTQKRPPTFVSALEEGCSRKRQLRINSARFSASVRFSTFATVSRVERTSSVYAAKPTRLTVRPEGANYQ